jgi:cell wall assembly regulator SMI1
MQQLQELEAWLAQHLPEVAADLRPGATTQDLDSLAAALGAELPEDFRALYAWHDGQAMVPNAGPWYGLSFLPLERVRRDCEMWREIQAESNPETRANLDRHMSSTPPGFVKTQYANGLWLPFAFDWGGNYLGIDLDPGERGRYGQVINFGRDEERKIAVAPSLGAFLDWMLEELAAGNFNIQQEDDGGRSFNTLRPPKSHFLDALAVLFPAA